MLKPARMAKIDLQVPEDNIAKITLGIANLNIIHLMNVRKTPLGEPEIESNQENALVCRYKELRNRTMNDIEDAIHMRLNYMTHSTTEKIPIEMFYEETIFKERIQKDIQEKRRNAIKNTTYKSGKQSKEKQGRVHVYGKGDMIFYYRFPANMLDTPWSGPHKVVGVSDQNNWIEIKEKN